MSTIPNDKYCTILEEEEDMFSGVCTNDGKKLWKYGIVPYVFNDNVSDELRSFVEKAMRMIEGVSFVKFEKKKTHQIDFLKIIEKGKFASYVGKKGDEQELHITKCEKIWPNTIGSIMHELMHALRFHHEHSRPDRDEHVDVGGNTGPNYDKHDESDVLCYGSFDIESIMNYSEEQGVTLKSGINARIGQRDRLSEGDIRALNNLYKLINASGLHHGYTRPDMISNSHRTVSSCRKKRILSHTTKRLRRK
ncbi:peptidase family M12A-domain-containing protein [Rhizophagus diaphanus]|nr:peptidase family M12A-domain-containing protein [Rhizophagus diaphanus] [Rhizophagus sp. MUCL 43196]